MKGFVPTPPDLVDLMVAKLFQARPPKAGDRLLDPGCGTGAFIEGVVRWCRQSGAALPQILGLDSDPTLLNQARQALGHLPRISFLNDDFLVGRADRFEFIVGNPPYVPIDGLTAEERVRYRKMFETAIGRFDLYLLFFEQALDLLAPGGRLVFVTPEKFVYTQTAAPLRRRLARHGVEEIHLVAESSFEGLTTYPTVTTVTGQVKTEETRLILRDGTAKIVRLGKHGASWLPQFNGTEAGRVGHVLSDACLRVSCGVATGADSVFVMRNTDVPAHLKRFAHPTVSGRSIAVGRGVARTHSILVPYNRSGVLLPEHKLGALRDFLQHPDRQARLLGRTCVARKPWYAFHETPPLREMLVPKILCKDIGVRPWFVVEDRGDILPRHSVYYLVPRDPDRIHDLCAHLNSAAASEWLMAHCQRAANGFVRLQSHVLKQVPIPEGFADSPRLALA